MPDSTVALWASKLIQFDYADAEETARDVVEAFDRMPSLKTFEEAIREMKRARWAPLSKGLSDPFTRPYPLAEHLVTHSEDRARAEAIPPGSLMGHTLARIVQGEVRRAGE